MSSVSYHPQTARVVVDVQNDFADPEGSLYVRGGEEVVTILNHEIEAARSQGSLVAYTADWHPPSTPHFQKDGGIWPVHCVAGTWGAEFHPDLMVEGPVVRKGSNGEDGYSGFTMQDPTTKETIPTELAGLLREHSIGEIVVAGLATDYCVKATALDGIREGFRVRLLTEAVRAVDLQPGDGQRALAEVGAAGVELL
jgi:nicotinamidase/pyrazinamidase